MKSIVGLGNLKILGAQESDAGSYRVVATSGGQTIEAIAELMVTSMSNYLLSPLNTILFSNTLRSIPRHVPLPWHTLKYLLTPAQASIGLKIFERDNKSCFQL